MSRLVGSVLAGAVSGLATWVVSVYSLAYTSAWAVPPGFPLKLWAVVVVYGLGVSAIALAIHLLALRATSGRPAAALASFAVAFVTALAVAGQLRYGQAVTGAALVGAVLASLTQLRLRPNNSSKPTPLRGAA